jgi:hypothetical protein
MAPKPLTASFAATIFEAQNTVPQNRRMCIKAWLWPVRSPIFVYEKEVEESKSRGVEKFRSERVYELKVPTHQSTP